MRIKLLMVLISIIALVFLTQCNPQAAETVQPAVETQPEAAGEQPTAASEPTTAPPTATSEPTEAPTEVPPTPEPVVTQNWSVHSSSATELSFGHPGDWIGPANLPFGEGVYVKDPEQDIGLIIQLELSGDPAQLLADWGEGDIAITGLVSFSPETWEDGESVIVSRIETPTRIAHGSGLTAQTAFIRRPQDVMQFLWYAPDDKWDEMADVFTKLLDSLEIWQKHIDLDLHTMYLHDWAAPARPPDANGLWFHSADDSSGMVLSIMDVADPMELLAAWQVDELAAMNFSECDTPQPGERMKGLAGSWESMRGECKNAAGVLTTYQVAFLPDKDRVLEMLVYSPSEDWEYATSIFSIMQDMLLDLR